MPRGQKPGWKLTSALPKVLPEKPTKVAPGVWLQPSGTFGAYLYHREKSHFLGCFPTVQAAIEARDVKRVELKSGRPLQARSATGETVTSFAEKVHFPEAHALIKESSARTTMSRYRQHVEPFFKDVALRDVTYDRCCSFRSAMLAKDVSGQTRREAVRILRSILEDAARRGLLPANPATLLRLPPKLPKPISVPSYDDALQVVAAISHPVGAMAAAVLLKTGMRLNECLSLTWPNVDLAAGTIFVAHSIDQIAGKIVTPKTATAVRVVDVPADLAAALKVYRAAQQAGTIQRNDPWVFPADTERTEGSPPVLNDRNFVQRYWEPAVKAVKCVRFTPHALRHLYASLLLMRGTPVAYVAQQLGHSSPAFTYRQYTRFLKGAGAEGRGYLERAFGNGG